MPNPEELVTIEGPVVTLFEPDWVRNARYSSGIVYSVQLANGSIITSPEKFPANSTTESGTL